MIAPDRFTGATGPACRTEEGEMEIQIKARDYKVDPQLRQFIQERVNKLDRFLLRVTDANLELIHEHPRTGGERFKAQLTVHCGHTILRAEERNAEVRRAVDLVVDKMEGRIRRYHSKRAERGKRHLVPGFPTLPELAPETLADLPDLDTDDEREDGRRVVRTKRFALKPMSSAEAIDHLELLGHDFFVFLNADDNQVNVLYRRKSGDYGLIQPA